MLETTTGSFAGAGAVVSSTPAPDLNLEYTFSFSQIQYLDRIDGIFLDKKGQFIVKEGNSSLNPSKPDPIDDAVPLFYAYIPAFTKTTKDVRVTPVDNRRYTMRDTSYIVSLCPSSNVYLDVTSVPEIILPAVSISGGCDDVPS